MVDEETIPVFIKLIVACVSVCSLVTSRMQRDSREQFLLRRLDLDHWLSMIIS